VGGNEHRLRDNWGALRKRGVRPSSNIPSVPRCLLHTEKSEGISQQADLCSLAAVASKLDFTVPS
jgi:hypothetical protein